MKHPPPPRLDNERHPTIDTFERVLNYGVIVDRSSDERPRTADPMSSLDLIDVNWRRSTHPFFRGETWKKSRRDD